jgi:phosphomannomutase/phosphomannomutase/phosphoglucomutase
MAADLVIFREYDIRGVFGNEFDLQFAYELGRTFATYHNRKTSLVHSTVAVGYDARISCPEIFQSLSKGLNDGGLDVLNLGLVTTPMNYFANFTLDITGTIMITGSHNPPEYNGFKICFQKSSVFGEEIVQLKKIYQSGEWFSSKSGQTNSFDIFPLYIDRYQDEFHKLKPLKVVLDCGNGAAGVIARKLFQSVGIEPIVLCEEPDGRFPIHHPDPTVEENLTMLKEAVLREKAALGIGFDGDADRIGLVDENGRMVYGDELMVLISRDILSHKKGAKIIGDVKCSDRLYSDIQAHGGEPIMWKTGHSLIKDKIKQEKAPFGGEMSGHIFFADRNYGYDDAVYAGLRVVEILSKTGKTVSQLLEGIPAAFNTPEIRIDTTEEKKLLIVEKLKEHFSQESPDYRTNLLDGIRISFNDGWALARASNTQPVLVLRYEASSQKRLDEIRASIEAITMKYL